MVDSGRQSFENATGEPIPTMLFNKEELLRILDHKGPSTRNICVVEQVPSMDSSPRGTTAPILTPTASLLVDTNGDPDMDIASDIDVDDIYQVLGRDILKSSLLSDMDLYLECDEDALYVMPKDRDTATEHISAAKLPARDDNTMKLQINLQNLDSPKKKGSFSCHECDYLAKGETLLKDHLAHAHGKEGQHVCSLCPYRGNYYRYLQKHMQRQHSEVVRRIIHTLKLHSHEIVELLDPPSNILQDYEDSFRDGNIISIQPGVMPVGTLTSVLEGSSAKPVENMVEVCGVVENVIEIVVQPDAQTGQDVMPNASNAETVSSEEEAVSTSPMWTNHQTFLPGVSKEKINSDMLASDYNEPVAMTDEMSEINPSLLTNPVTDTGEMPFFSDFDNQRYLAEDYRLVNDHYQCVQCKAKFKQKRTITQHLKKHAGVYEHTCECCDKSFASRDSLRRHSLMHHKEKSIACTSAGCPQVFRFQSQLKEHMIRVHGGKTHTCPHVGCHRAFALARELKSHMNLHQGTFTCSWDGCRRRFRDRYNLQTHLNMHSGEKTLQCVVCPYKCVQKASLNWHMKTKHCPQDTRCGDQ